MKVPVVLILTATFGCLLGCGGTDHPPTKPVSGKVTYNGKPVTGAVVSFHLQEGESPRNGTGQTNEEGEFEITTFESGDGAILGKHKVTIVKTEGEIGQSGEVDTSDPGAAYDQAMRGAAQGKSKGKHLVPEKYATVELTPLEYSITEDSDNNYEIELKD
ncbi:MAG: hypothetical protein KDA84_12100 [Planctomycetaceae bacterium]|nr:hypothetical protein [Planctomycetaceae bacterium]